MLDTAYSFGTPLRDAIIKGTYTRTALGQLFEKELYQSTGIKAIYTDFSADIPYLSSPYIFIHANIKAQSSLFDSDRFYVTDGVFYPNKELKQAIEACFQQAARNLGLPPVTFPEAPEVTTSSIHDYMIQTNCLYFNVNVKSIDRAARSAFPHIDFMLRFRLCYVFDDFKPYYLIFANRQTKARADLNGDSARIVAFVQSYCRARDPLGIFADFSPVPEVTDKETLQAKGLVMGIMRENPDFNEW